ncbi:MAG TPA: rod shape-determining protein MreD [Candidatus Moranbacteria bacterium]|nr:rod shape-determining protein MreD [Candidatus Moranbacteria bacterium]
MFQKIIILLIIFFSAVIQVSVFPRLFPSGLSPEIVLMLVIFWTSRDGFEKTWPKAVLSGFMLDLFYFWPAGTNIIAFALVSYGVGFFARRFTISQKNMGLLVLLLLSAMGSAANSLILLILAKIYKGLGLELGIFLPDFWNRMIFLKILIDMLLFVMIYWPLSGLERFLSFYGKKSMQGRFFK